MNLGLTPDNVLTLAVGLPLGIGLWILWFWLDHRDECNRYAEQHEAQRRGDSGRRGSGPDRGSVGGRIDPEQLEAVLDAWARYAATGGDSLRPDHSPLNGSRHSVIGIRGDAA